MTTEPIDLTGCWRGHYEQDGARHGIALEVAHKGESIVGRMRDEDTLMMGSMVVQGEDEHGARRAGVHADGPERVVRRGLAHVEPSGAGRVVAGPRTSGRTLSSQKAGRWHGLRGRRALHCRA